MRYIIGLTIVLGALLSSWPVQAEVHVTVGNLQLQPGGTGYIDVMAEGQGDLVQSFGLDLRITTTAPSWLQFDDPQPADYLSDQDYLFHDESYLAANQPMSFGSVGLAIVPGDMLVGGDFRPNSTDVLVNGQKLLTRLQVTANTLMPPSVGDTFTISLAPDSSTYFSDSVFNAIQYSAVPGTVTIALVPEPGTLSLVAAGSLLVFLGRCRARFRAHSASGTYLASETQMIS
jgi:hypothetical protein